MSIRTVVTRGYANGGSIPFVVRRGYSQAAFVASISVTLTDANNNAIANLTGLKWAWWDQATLNMQVAPTAQGTGASTDASGVFSVTTLAGSALGPGQVGWLEVSDSDGTTTQSPVANVAAGPITVH